MKTPDEGREWVRRWTASIAETLLSTRGRTSAQQLSNRCAELGYPIPRSTIQNLEIGRKESITLQEVVVLARALDIPPLQLIFSIGREDMTEALPGHSMPTWLAAKWFTGEGAFPREMAGGGWTVDSESLATWRAGIPGLFRKLDQYYAELAEARTDVRSAEREAAEADESDAEHRNVRVARNLLRLAEDQLREHRALIRSRGLDPGPLSPDWAYIDEPREVS